VGGGRSAKLAPPRGRYAQGPPVSLEPSSKRFPWMKVALVAGAVVVGVGVGIGVAVAQGSGGGATPKLGAGLDPGTTFCVP